MAFECWWRDKPQTTLLSFKITCLGHHESLRAYLCDSKPMEWVPLVHKKDPCQSASCGHVNTMTGAMVIPQETNGNRPKNKHTHRLWHWTPRFRFELVIFIHGIFRPTSFRHRDVHGKILATPNDNTCSVDKRDGKYDLFPMIQLRKRADQEKHRVDDMRMRRYAASRRRIDAFIRSSMDSVYKSVHLTLWNGTHQTIFQDNSTGRSASQANRSIMEWFRNDTFSSKSFLACFGHKFLFIPRICETIWFLQREVLYGKEPHYFACRLPSLVSLMFAVWNGVFERFNFSVSSLICAYVVLLLDM